MLLSPGYQISVAQRIDGAYRLRDLYQKRFTEGVSHTVNVTSQSGGARPAPWRAPAFDELRNYPRTTSVEVDEARACVPP